MTLLSIQHRVADFDTWKRTFDGDPLDRATKGVVEHAIYRPPGDPHQVLVHLLFDTREAAEGMLTALQELWGREGARIGFGDTSAVQARILDEVENVVY